MLPRATKDKVGQSQFTVQEVGDRVVSAFDKKRGYQFIHKVVAIEIQETYGYPTSLHVVSFLINMLLHAID